MTVFDSLNLPLAAEAPEGCRQLIAGLLWNLHYPPLTVHKQPYLEELCDSYFAPNGYYAQQCCLFDYGSFASAETHRNVVDIAKLLQSQHPREEVQKLVSQFLRPGDQTQHSMSINLVVRLILMMKVGVVSHECIGRRQLEWKFGSLQEFVRAHFCKPRRRSHERLKLEKLFNGLNLHRITGIEVKWTDNLADHLQMMNDDKIVAIFRHPSFLKAHRTSPMYPPGFIEETLRTMSLLFPQDDPATRKWFGMISKASKSPLDSHLIKTDILDAEARQFDNFEFWHDRLVVLKQVFDETRPSTISQWWHDRRHPVEWCALWTAIIVIVLTVIFGLVQCILSGLQVEIALRSIRL